MKKLMILAATLLAGSVFAACECDCPYAGRWALTIPGGGAGWLGVTCEGGKCSSSMLWGGGSVVPNDLTVAKDGALVITRTHKNKKGVIVETITAKATGDALALETQKVGPDGKVFDKAAFTGKRIPPVPAAPDLKALKFGKPIALLNGKDLTGWTAMNPGAYNGWSVKDGTLLNRVAGQKKHGTNIRTEQTFEDFNLKTEVKMEKGSNSGIYLRGIYEIQMLDSYGKPVDSHNMGALYSRLTPACSAEKPAGEWQTIDITLCDRHVTVILNGKTIIDNQPVLGCTGGAITSDEFKAGPIYLQGDHSDVSYRNMVLTPILK